MLENIKNTFKRKPSKVPEYGLLYFDHIHGEYCLLVSSISDVEDMKRLDKIQKKREADILTWEDILLLFN